MTDTSTCSNCGNTDRDGLIPVIDETGSKQVCGLCVIGKFPRWVQAGAVTVLVDLPTALST